jgi:hypothetical protein
MGMLQSPDRKRAGAIAFPVAAARPAMADKYAIADEHSLNWNRLNLRQKTRRGGSVMLPLRVRLRIGYWHSLSAAQ